MVLLPRIRSSIVVGLVPTIGHGILERRDLLRELFVTLVEFSVVTHEDSDVHVPEAVQKHQVHEEIDHLHEAIDPMFDHIRHLSDKGFKEELVENVEKGFLCAGHYLNGILYIHVYIFCSSFLLS